MPGRRSWLRWLIGWCGLIWLAAGGTAAAQGPAPVAQPSQILVSGLGAPPGRISLLAQQPAGQTLYAVSVATPHGGDDPAQGHPRSDAIYRSDDLGASWQPFTNNLLHGAITALYADPHGSGQLYAGLFGAGDETAHKDGLWQSQEGAGWRQVALGRDGLKVRRVARNADGSLLLVGATGGEEFPPSYVYLSQDDGRTWSEVEALRFDQRPQNALRDLIPHPTEAARLFITTEGGDLVESRDAGATWTRLALPPQLDAPAAAGPALLALDPAQPQTMLLARNLGTGPGSGIALAASRDGGKTWRMQTAAGLPERGELFALAARRGGAWLLSTGVGSYRTTDGGATWRLMEGPLGSGSVAAFLSLADAPRTVIAAGGYGLFISRDSGGVWQRLGTGLPANLPIAGLLTDARQPGVVLAVVDRRPVAGAPQPPAVLRSADGGRTWLAAAQDMPETQPDAWALDPADPNTVYVAGDGQLMKSEDGGLTWQTTALPPGPRHVAAVSPTYRNVVYLGGAPLLRSTDAGAAWQEAPVVTGGAARQPGAVTGLVVDPMDARHLWAALDSGGVFESRDGGDSWRAAGLSGQPVRWLASRAEVVGGNVALTLFAGIPEKGVARRSSGASEWSPAAQGLPEGSTVASFFADPTTPGVLWAGLDGGGFYRSEDDGENWQNAGAGLGDNRVQALAEDPRTPGEVMLATAAAGLWRTAADQPATGGSTDREPDAVDARIEIVWPHDWAPVAEAKQANISLRLFQPNSLAPAACAWTPDVTMWQAAGSDPAEPIGQAEPRTVDGQPYPVFDLNDVDVSPANDPATTLYFMVRVQGTETATSIWAHGADPRTLLPFQEQPSGLAAGTIKAADTRIQVVWPHDEAGNPRPVAEAPLANVAVAVFEHGTRLSAPVTWRPKGLTLYGAWDHEIGRPLSRKATMQIRKAGAITYPVWEFNNIPVARAADPGAKLYLWVVADGVETYPSIWAHGADARTVFPAMDEPIQGCFP